MLLSLNHREVFVLIRVVNRYIEDHPEGESAEEAKNAIEKMKGQAERRKSGV